MKNRFIIRNIKTGELIEVFSLNSERSELIFNISDVKNFNDNVKFSFSRDKLKNKIIELISQRKNHNSIDFGNRFENNQCYQKLIFNGKEYILETSGTDNLIVFAINLFNSAQENFLIKNKI